MAGCFQLLNLGLSALHGGNKNTGRPSLRRSANNLCWQAKQLAARITTTSDSDVMLQRNIEHRRGERNAGI